MKGMPRSVTMRRDGYGLRDPDRIKKKHQNTTEKKSKYERKRIKQKYQNTKDLEQNHREKEEEKEARKVIQFPSISFMINYRRLYKKDHADRRKKASSKLIIFRIQI